MINDKSSYNIEDTARLMTSSKGPKRKLMIILIVIALLLVLAIGIFGVRNIKEKRYNAQVEMADKAFVEGNYELAESGYLKAVGMNKRKPKARENLAYTYAVQDRLEDAARMYDELYKDTKEPKYQEAFQDTSEGRVPANPEMAPAKGVWREVDFDIVPYKETLNDYIVRMTFDCFSVVSGTGMGKDASFDYKNPDGFFVLPVVLGGCGLYGFSIEEQIKYKSEGGNDVATPGFEMKEGIDPRNWIKNNDENQLEDFFIVYEADIADNVIRNVFNLNDEHIDNMVKKGEKE
jgi:tetratricopeptide (TPR) repeat protein